MNRRKKIGLRLLLAILALVLGTHVAAHASIPQVCQKVEFIENVGYVGPKSVDNVMTKVIHSELWQRWFHSGSICAG